MHHRHTHSIRRRGVVAALLTCLGLLALAPTASAGEKVTICHATGSATNPYVQVTVSENAVEAHRAHQEREDIIPAPATGCPGPVVPRPADVCPNIDGDQGRCSCGLREGR